MRHLFRSPLVAEVYWACCFSLRFDKVLLRLDFRRIILFKIDFSDSSAVPMDSSLLRVGLQVYAWIIWAMLTLLSSGNVDRTSWLHLFFPLPQALENEGTCALTVWRSTFEQESYLQSLLEDTSCFPFRRECPFSPASLLKVFCPRLTKDVRNTHLLVYPYLSSWTRKWNTYDQVYPRGSTKYCFTLRRWSFSDFASVGFLNLAAEMLL